MKKYRVQVRRVEYSFQLLTVEAETPKLARRKALRAAKENPDDFCDTSVGGCSIRFVEDAG